MAAIDFPANPILNQQYSQGTTTWQWDGTAWNIVPQMGPLFVGDLPPSNPAAGQQWLRTTNMQLYAWYVDPTSSQWIQVSGPGPAPGTWEPAGQNSNGLYDLTGKSQQDITGLGAYLHLRVTVDALMSATSQIGLRVSDDNGTTFKAGASDYSYSNMVVINGAVTGYPPANNNLYPVTGSQDGNFINAAVEIAAFNKARAASIRLDTIFFTTTSATQRQFPHGYSATQTARNALRIFTSAGVFTSGILMIEGIRG